MWGDLLQFIGDLLYNRAAILTGGIPVAARLFGSARAGKRFLRILCSGSDAMNDFFVLFTGLQPFDNLIVNTMDDRGKVLVFSFALRRQAARLEYTGRAPADFDTSLQLSLRGHWRGRR